MVESKERIIPIYVEDEMKNAYIDYAMSVIIGRALPDARDGLKPVHRRILYAMHQMGLAHNKPFKKSARITGETMGKFHPHGDLAVYDALVRMAQDFSLRYPLIDGQGNFGCFTKDTKVKLTNGRNLTFEQLVNESKKRKRNWTFSFNIESKKIEIAEIKNPRLTRRNEKIMEVTLDNKEKIKCTLDHRFMLKNGFYKKAKDLKHGDSLMPSYTEIYEKERYSRYLPKSKNALNHFNNFLEIVAGAREQNHRVVKTKILHKREDTYDLTVEPHHNFALAAGIFVHNSVDGDSAAASRYTEARLSKISDEMLKDIEKETVDFIDNYDRTQEEPTVLPARVPGLLINGSSGIAVGMATNIPPHNLGEVVDAIVVVINNSEIEVEKLIPIIKGPDFPTGALICGKGGIGEAYTTGRGHITLRAKVDIEEYGKEKERIIVTEIPYQVNKARVLESIASLVRAKKIEGIADLRDESDREGMRIVIELKRDEIAQVVLNQLFKHTQLQTTFGVIMLALVDNQPRILNLKQLIACYVEHRRKVTTRRVEYELKRDTLSAHILEGLKIAVTNLNKTVEIIKASKSAGEAQEKLIKVFKLSEKQVRAILDVKLQHLTRLEREKIDLDYKELKKKIGEYEITLKNPQKVLDIIKDELLSIKEEYGDKRRTQITEAAVEEFRMEDLITEENMAITVSYAGYVKRLPVSAYRIQQRGGKGVIGMETREGDYVKHLFIASTHQYILCFTNKGKVHWLKTYEIPQAGRLSTGKAIINLIRLDKDEFISAFVPVEEFSDKYFLVMATRRGVVKRTKLSAYSNPRASGIVALRLDKEDRLMKVELTDGLQDIILGTRAGLSIRFKESQIRVMGRGARGVKGIKLAQDDRIIGMEVVREKATVLSITENGYGKRTEQANYRIQSRGGKGVINIRTTKRNGSVVGIEMVDISDELIIATVQGMVIQIPVKDIRSLGRNTQGVHLIKLGPEDKVVDVARVISELKEGEKNATEEK